MEVFSNKEIFKVNVIEKISACSLSSFQQYLVGKFMQASRTQEHYFDAKLALVLADARAFVRT